MTDFGGLSRRPRSRPARRRVRFPWRLLAGLVFAAVTFALGLALGQSLEEQPRPGERTEIRTLEPLPLPPERETVTVTTTHP